MGMMMSIETLSPGEQQTIITYLESDAKKQRVEFEKGDQDEKHEVPQEYSTWSFFSLFNL